MARTKQSLEKIATQKSNSKSKERSHSKSQKRKDRKERLEKKTVEELKEIAKKKSIKGISGLKKEEIIRKILKYYEEKSKKTESSPQKVKNLTQKTTTHTYNFSTIKRPRNPENCVGKYSSKTREELYEIAKKKNVYGRSKMTKNELCKQLFDLEMTKHMKKESKKSPKSTKSHKTNKSTNASSSQKKLKKLTITNKLFDDKLKILVTEDAKWKTLKDLANQRWGRGGLIYNNKKVDLKKSIPKKLKHHIYFKHASLVNPMKEKRSTQETSSKDQSIPKIQTRQTPLLLESPTKSPYVGGWVEEVPDSPKRTTPKRFSPYKGPQLLLEYPMSKQKTPQQKSPLRSHIRSPQHGFEDEFDIVIPTKIPGRFARYLTVKNYNDEKQINEINENTLYENSTWKDIIDDCSTFFGFNGDIILRTRGGEEHKMDPAELLSHNIADKDWFGVVRKQNILYKKSSGLWNALFT